MRKIIKGRMYDTDTATRIGTREHGLGPCDIDWVSERLYKKKTGEFFLAGEGGPRTRYAVDRDGDLVCGGEDIIPLDMADAKEWAESYLTADEYILAFGEPDE